MSCSLIFIDNKEDIEILEGLIGKETIVISIIPAVSAILKKKGIPFETTLNFFGTKGHKYVHKRSFEVVEKIRPFVNYDEDKKMKYYKVYFNEEKWSSSL